MSETVNVNLDDLNYYILPSKRFQNSSYAQVQDKVFDFWVEEWTKAFNATGAPKSGWEDHFVRQDVITVLTHKTEIIGCHLYTFYNLEAHATRCCEYFEYIDDLMVQKLKKKGIFDSMSMEYLVVSDKWQKNSLRVSFGKVILALGTYVAELKGADCILGMPIFGNKVDQMLENIGAHTIQDGIEKYGYQLKLMMAPTKPRIEGKDPVVREITDALWDRRIDYTTEYDLSILVAS